MKVKPWLVKKEDKIKYLDTLYTSLSTLKSRDEIKCFIRDLLTDSEKIMIGRRILIAKKLLEGKVYTEIMNEMNVGIDTIVRVNKWIQDESKKHEKVILNLEKEFNKRRKGIKLDDKPFSRLRKKYPMHFFLLIYLISNSLLQSI